MTHAPHVIDRYVLFDAIASGGMATVHYGRMIGAAGFARTVAIKRLHPQFAKDPEFVSMFLDEARLAARIRHLYVVPTLDVVAHEGEVLLVMEYVQGVSLSYLARVHRQKGEPIPAPVAVGILVNALSGLQAVHDATGEDGMALDVVHRDVSPQNILVGIDGAARIADFGIAKAMGRLQTTREGQVKGKSGYMAPEQIRGQTVDRRTDVFAASVVLWEVLTGERLFASDSPLGAMNQVLERSAPPPSSVRPRLPPELDAIVLRGLERDPARRFATAHDMGAALEAAVEVASSRTIGAWVQAAAPEVLAARAERVAEIESSTTNGAALVGAERAESESVRESAETASASVVEPAPGPGRRSARARTRSIAVGVLLAVVAAGGVLVSVRTRESRRAASEAAEAGVAVVALIPSPDAAPPVADPQPSSEPPRAVATAAATPRPGEPRADVKSRPRRPAKPSTPNQVATCNPPYTFDAAGVRHWKDGC